MPSTLGSFRSKCGWLIDASSHVVSLGYSPPLNVSRPLANCGSIFAVNSHASATHLGTNRWLRATGAA